jgi:Putative zinc-finger
MCDFSGKLIAWLDHELAEGEARGLERHVQSCAECRLRADAYQEVSRAFDAFCENAMASNTRRKLPLWAPVLAGVAVAAVALLLALPRPRATQPAVRPQLAAVSPVVMVETAPAPVKRAYRRRVVPPAQRQVANRLPPEPSIEIAFPADAMFPPGAVPEGVNFIAEVSVGPDGMAHGLRLQPQLAKLERRSNLP